MHYFQLYPRQNTPLLKDFEKRKFLVKKCVSRFLLYQYSKKIICPVGYWKKFLRATP